MSNDTRENLASRLGFLLLSAGCAIGLGNVWRFPFITGKYGGAVFLIAYLLFLAIMGLPVLIMEFAVGRAPSQTQEFVDGYIKPVLEEKKDLLGIDVEINV